MDDLQMKTFACITLVRARATLATAPMLLLALLLTQAAHAATHPSVDSAQAILLRIEKNTSLKEDVTAKVTLVQQKASQGVKTIEMQFFRRDADKSFLIVMTAPPAEKGNGYLRVDDHFWMYRRNTRSFQHVNRDENIGGTQAQGDDFEDRKLTEMYKPETDSSGRAALAEEMLGAIAVYKLTVTAKAKDVDYPRKIYWARKDNGLLLKEQSFALSGALMQTSYFLKYTPIGDSFVPVEQIFIDEFEKGNKTKMNLTQIELKPLSKHLFTKAYLENLSQ